MENQNVLPPSKENGNIRMMGYLLIAGILIPHIGGWLCVLIYYIFKKEGFTAEEHAVFLDIMNFNISFLLYGIISGFLMLLVIGFVLLPLVVIVYLILLIISIVQYIAGRSYKYPLTIRFL